MPRRNALRGSKFSGRHTTIVEEGRGLIGRLKKCDTITKIIIGHIKVIRKGPCRVRVKTIPAGLELMVRVPSARQLFLVYTLEPCVVKESIRAWGGKKGFAVSEVND